MFSKENLLSEPSDENCLDGFELHLVEAGERYIEGIVVRGFEVDKISFGCSKSDVFARVTVDGDNSYFIEFGRKLTSAILKVSEEVSSRINNVLPWLKAEDAVVFIFDYLSWFVLHHEVAHIIHGHLEYVLERGIKGYVEINDKFKPLIHLHKDVETSKEYWRALESEADAFAVGSSLPSYLYINRTSQWALLDENSAWFCHGVMVSIVYHLMSALAKGVDDFRHPDPRVRLNLTLASINLLAKGYSRDVGEITGFMVDAQQKVASDLLRIPMDYNKAIESASYMLTLDKVVASLAISGYRKRKRKR